jgi:hypothetical protein
MGVEACLVAMFDRLFYPCIADKPAFSVQFALFAFKLNEILFFYK